MMDNLFKKVMILNGKFEGCKGKIVGKNKKYYMVEIYKWIDMDSPDVNIILLDIKDFKKI